MQESIYKRGQKLEAVYCPWPPDGETPSGGAVGYDQVTEIVVDRAAGPMGWYDVAVIKRGGLRPDMIVPLHMAEEIRTYETS